MVTVAAAQGSRSSVYYKKQSALGTAATGDFGTLRFNTQGLKVSKESVESSEIRSDREVSVFRHGNRSTTGDIEVELCYGDHDALIEAAMFNPFTAGVCSIGVTPQYLSLEDAQLDIGKYQLYQDQLATTMKVTIAPNAMVTATFSLVGTDGANVSDTSSAGTPTEASSNEPFDSFTGSIYDDAAETSSVAILTAIEFTVENSVAAAFAVGQQTAVNLEYGRGNVTGQLTAYFVDETWINRFLNEDEFAIVVNLSDPDGNEFEFKFPRCKLTDADHGVQNEQSRTITLPFQALLDSTLGTAFQITATDAA